MATSLMGVEMFFDNIATYYTGGYAVLGLLLIVLLIIVLTSVGIDFRYSVLFTLPILAGFIYAGWFASMGGWILVVSLLIVGLIYGYVLYKLFTGG